MNSNQKILFDCKKATMLIEKKLLSSLTIREGIELKLHLTSCSVCRLYQSQTTIISAMVEQILSQHKVNGLAEQFKHELREKIDLYEKKGDLENDS